MSDLSEEEIINRLKERIKIDRSMRLNVESDFDRFCEEECQAIEELIDLYNKEKEKNKKLEEKIASFEYALSNGEIETVNKFSNVKPTMLVSSYTYGKEVVNFIKKNYISKNKIREIIKGLDKRVIENSEINYFAYLTVGEALSFKRFLEKELLEEE